MIPESVEEMDQSLGTSLPKVAHQVCKTRQFTVPEVSEVDAIELGYRFDKLGKFERLSA
jgi:hypothetical protein